jgi:hypothetical protein
LVTDAEGQFGSQSFPFLKKLLWKLLDEEDVFDAFVDHFLIDKAMKGIRRGNEAWSRDHFLMCCQIYVDETHPL